MRRILSGVVLGLLLIAGGVRSEPPKAAPGDPMANPLQGTWVVVDYESQGKKLKTAVGTTFEVQGQRLIRKSKAGTAFTYQLHIDANKVPQEIDLIPASGTTVGTGKVLKGIYQLQGDMLKIVYPTAAFKGVEKPRPLAFMTNAGDGYLMYTLQKQK